MNNDSFQGAKYDIGGEIGRGGMGAVWQATDRVLNRTVAMKVIRAGNVRETDRLRFLREAEVLAQLEHPNIVPIHDLALDADSQPFYTMKLVRGVSLKDVINRLKSSDAETVAQYSLSQLLTVFQRVCDAVAFAHSKGIIHRDLKPENIMLGDFGEVLVMDWGLAKVLGGGRARLSERAEAQEGEDACPPPVGSGALGEPRPTTEEGFQVAEDLRPPSGDGGHDLTLEGTIMGTPQFMAPEQAEGRVHDIDARSDIFSLGGILYSLLTLRPPTGGTTVKEVLANIKSGYIAPPTIYNKARRRAADGTELEAAIDLVHCPGNRIPDSLAAVCMKAMAVEQADRYQSVQELQREIAAYQGGFATSAEAAGALRQLWLLVCRHKAVFGLTAVALIVIGTLTGGFLWQQTRTLKALRSTAPTFYDLARTRMDEQKWDEALKNITDALALRPGEAEYQVLKGHIHQARLALPEAQAAYRRALELKPEHPSASMNLRVTATLLKRDGAPAKLSVQELDSLRLEFLKQDRRPEALEISRRIGKGNQELYETWKAIFEKLGIKASVVLNRDGQFELDLSKSTIKNLSPLKGMPLTRLLLNGCTNVNDVAPLKGMPLKELGLEATKVHNLAPLRGMPLESMNLNMTPVTDLSALKGMPLTSLAMQWAWIKDLTPLKGLPLTYLWLYETGVSDLTPLQGMSLQTLMLYRTKVTDLSPLRGMPLNDLTITATAVTDLRPLQGLPLTSFSAAVTQVSDLTPITGAPLIGLNLADCPKITDISPLRGMPLKYLQLQGCTGVRDLGPLTTCVDLEYLTIPLTAQNVGLLRQLPKLKKLSYTLPQNDWNKIPPIEEFWKAYDARKAKK